MSNKEGFSYFKNCQNGSHTKPLHSDSGLILLIHNYFPQWIIIRSSLVIHKNKSTWKNVPFADEMKRFTFWSTQSTFLGLYLRTTSLGYGSV